MTSDLKPFPFTDTLYLFEHHGDRLESVAVRSSGKGGMTSALSPEQRARIQASVVRALTMSSELAQELDRRERAAMAARREASLCLWCIEGFTVAGVLCCQCGGTGRRRNPCSVPAQQDDGLSTALAQARSLTLAHLRRGEDR